MADDDLNLKPKPTTNHTPQTQTQILSPPQFSHTIFKIAVAQICQSFGFTAAQTSALDSLTRIAALYIQSLSSRAASRAAFCGGRTQCNLFDVVHALEDLRLSSGGFPGAGDIFRPLLSSSTLKELSRFIDAIDEVPFARRIPRPETGSGPVVFPARKNPQVPRWLPDVVEETKRVSKREVFPGMSHRSVRKRPEVPRWLPEFPDVVEEPKRVSKREPFWEEETFHQPLPLLTTGKEDNNDKKGNLGFLLRGRRERVKFRVGLRNGKIGIDDLELRNGVCRGGKRVCLAKRVNTFLDEDEDEAIESGNGKSR